MRRIDDPLQPQIRLAELLGALSHALDLTEGQPRRPLHALLLDRHRISAAQIGLSDRRAVRTLLHAAAEGSRLLAAMPRASASSIWPTTISFKRDFKLINGSLPQALRFVLAPYRPASRPGRALPRHHQHPAEWRRDRPRTDRDPLPSRRRHRPPACGSPRRSPTASRTSTSTGTAAASRTGLAGEAIPLFCAHRAAGAGGRCLPHRRRPRRPPCAKSRTAPAPGSIRELVEAFERVAGEPDFWDDAGSADDLASARPRPGAGQASRMASTRTISTTSPPAFAQVIDAKSPFTGGHSERVAAVHRSDRRGDGL